MPKIVICADDLGLTVGINRGIEEAFNRGALTSASLMANTPGFDDACARIQKNPRWSIGIHLNVLRGRPVLKSKNEFFRNNFLSLGVSSLKKSVQEEIEREYRAQIEKALNRGVKPDHLNSEKHHHMLPTLFPIVWRLAKEYGISHVRVTKEFPKIPQCLSQKKLLLAFLSRFQPVGLPFWGLGETGEMTLEVYEHFFRHFKGEAAEIMCHPGFETEEDRRALKEFGPFHLKGENREKELAALLDIRLKLAAKEAGIQLVSFKDLKNGNA